MIKESNSTKTTLIILGIVLLWGIGFYLWLAYAVPHILKVPKDLSYTADLVSVDNFFDENLGEYSGEKHSNSFFSYHVASQKNNIVNIQNNFEVRSFDGRKIFSSNPVYGIDEKTWMHVKGEGDKDREGYLFAPRNLKKDQIFTYWHVSTSVGAQMKYVAEENLYGLKVYKYEKINLDPVDQSEFFTHLQGIPEKRGIKLVNKLYLWIEPVSGHIVKQEEFSDDYYFFDRKTGERLGVYNKFSNVYSEKSVIEHIHDARVEKYKVLLVTYGIPILFFIAILLPNILRFSHLSKTRKIELFGLIVALLFILTTLGVTYFINKNVNESEQQKFSDEADEILLTIERRFGAYIDILRGAQGFVAASSFVDRDEWTSYIKNLELEKKYPGVLAIGYAPVVDPDRTESFIQDVQKNDLKDFRIFPEKVTKKYAPVLYIEPRLERNLKAIGFNFYSEEDRTDALDRAYKLKDLSVTSKIELINEPDNDKQPGFLIYIPIMRQPQKAVEGIYTNQDVTGYVFAAFRMDDLMKNIFTQGRTDLDFHIFDGLRTVPESHMFDYDEKANIGVKTVFKRVDILNIADRAWAVEFFNDPSFQVDKTKKLLPIVIMIGGIIFSILFYLVFYVLFTTKRKL